tara:strand:+ start:255 stop:488 length:234 start_codon:yes stop_codon:yes gene_type:complete
MVLIAADSALAKKGYCWEGCMKAFSEQNFKLPGTDKYANPEEVSNYCECGCSRKKGKVMAERVAVCKEEYLNDYYSQ